MSNAGFVHHDTAHKLPPTVLLADLCDIFGESSCKSFRKAPLSGGTASVVQIDACVWHGGTRSLSSSSLRDIPHLSSVVNLADTVVDCQEHKALRSVGVDVLDFPLSDSTRVSSIQGSEAVAQTLAGAANAIRKGQQGGGHVLVHCLLGRSRSAAALLWYLLDAHPEWSLIRAFAELRTANPAAYPCRDLLACIAAHHPACQYIPGTRDSMSFSDSDRGSEASASVSPSPQFLPRGLRRQHSSSLSRASQRKQPGMGMLPAQVSSAPQATVLSPGATTLAQAASVSTQPQPGGATALSAMQGPAAATSSDHSAAGGRVVPQGIVMRDRASPLLRGAGAGLFATQAGSLAHGHRREPRERSAAHAGGEGSKARVRSCNDIAALASKGWTSASFKRSPEGGSWDVTTAHKPRTHSGMTSVLSSPRAGIGAGDSGSDTAVSEMTGLAEDSPGNPGGDSSANHVPTAEQVYLCALDALHAQSSLNVWSRLQNMEYSVAKLQNACAGVVPGPVSQQQAEEVLMQSKGNVDAAVGLLLMQ